MEPTKQGKRNLFLPIKLRKCATSKKDGVAEIRTSCYAIILISKIQYTKNKCRFFAFHSAGQITIFKFQSADIESFWTLDVGTCPATRLPALLRRVNRQAGDAIKLHLEFVRLLFVSKELS